MPDFDDDDLEEDLIGPRSRKEKPPMIVFHKDAKQLVSKGVSVNWLSVATGYDRRTIDRKLAKLIPTGSEGGNRNLYNFRQAIDCLAKPRVDIAEYIKTANPKDLPVTLQREYWAAMAARQNYMIKAGDLWKTEDVLDTLGEAFKLLKNQMQLWVDTLDRRTSLSDEQRLMLTESVDALQNAMHQALIEMPKDRQTPSQLAEAEAETEQDEAKSAV